ncbi:MAG: hypothetical protein IK012_04655 [Fibrobacter sp.]|uniref:hypothetical protein n=1 Tax=Fibrobacter sp. TaxID=35828 RepID=UPI0025C3472A|nr:hypothetical protein [Fibrobacter sp.]MBR4784529.1 hypothetical protein [Fibrobacter sp.]
MKKKNIALLSFLVVWAIALTACLFDSSDSSLSSWLSDQGLPDSYKVQMLTVEDLTPVSAKAYAGNSVFAVTERVVFGTQAGLSHDAVFDFAFIDSSFLGEMKDADSAAAFVVLFVNQEFYSAKQFPKDSLPYEETLDLKLEWILDNGQKKSFVDSVGKVSVTDWLEELKEWKADNSADTSYDLSIGAKDSLVRIDLPSTFVEDMKKAGPACHLQLRVSAPEAKRLYRFYGPNSDFPPEFRMRSVSDTNIKRLPPFRMSNIVVYNDSCEDCLVVHGGVLDSIVVEYPSDKILEALSDFYGDAFPFEEGDGNDVRQAVVLAQLNLVRDDAEGYAELGLPIQVVVGSFVDSLDEEIRRMEMYKVNRKLVAESGHPNMVFYDGDSLSLQVTYGLRDLINQAKDGRNFKMMVRLGYPVLQDKDSLYTDYKTADGDSVYVFFKYFDYARYDFGKTFSQPAQLKLWLATKRGGEE